MGERETPEEEKEEKKQKKFSPNNKKATHIWHFSVHGKNTMRKHY